MKIIKDKYDKKLIGNLPRVQFEGRIIIIINEKDSQKAVEYLLNQEILGLDTETRPSFKKGISHKVALLQVSTEDTCFLFRLNRIGLTAPIKKLLEDCTVPKVGLSLHDDLRMLSHRGDFTPGNYIEIQKEVKELGIEDLSLQKIFANIFGKKIAKNQQLSNWEAESLTEAQQIYAATDAWACIQIHKELIRLKKEGNYKLEKTKSEQETYPISENSPIA